MNTVTNQPSDKSAAESCPLKKSIVLVGLMGVGKSCIGRRLASRLDLPFVDADAEIEAAAGCAIEDIFKLHGEAAFRDGERRVVTRLLAGPVQVLATGGGAFMDEEIRARIRKHGISVWLRADINVLVKRVSRRTHRPLLKDRDPRQVLKALMAERDPVYATADLVVDTQEGSPRITANAVINQLEGHLGVDLVRRRGARGMQSA